MLDRVNRLWGMSYLLVYGRPPDFKIRLATNLAFLIWMGIGFVELMPQYMGPKLIPIHNSQFSLDSH